MSDAKSTEPSLEYFSECERAIGERRFADALFLLDEGLRSNYHSPQPVNSKSLIRHLFSLIGILKLRLEEDFGGRWEDEVRKRMPPDQTEVPEMRCSFCGQSRDNVSNLVTGPSVNICNECVDICVEIIADAKSE